MLLETPQGFCVDMKSGQRVDDPVLEESYAILLLKRYGSTVFSSISQLSLLFADGLAYLHY